MKIFLCKSHFAGPVSGADETLVTYATHLHQAGHQLVVVLMHRPSKTDPYYARLTNAGVEVLSISSFRVFNLVLNRARKLANRVPWLLRLQAWGKARKTWCDITYFLSLIQARRCREYFELHTPDLIHVVTPDPGAATMVRAGRAAGIPVLYQELGTPHYLNELSVHYARFSEVLPMCSEVATLSPSLARQWAESFFPRNSISVLPLLVDDTRFVRAPKQKQAPGIRFGFAARLERGKGPLILVAAFARVRSELRNAALVIAGTGPQEREVRARVRELDLLDACDFPGAYTRTEDKSAFMRGVDAFVLPTLAEGTPNSIIEAMAHGLPVIASAVGGIPDMITPETGILVPPGDVAALTKAMLLLATRPDLCAQMGQAARERYEKLFSPHAVLPVLLGAYRRLAAVTESESSTAAAVDCFIHPWGRSFEMDHVPQDAIAESA